MAEDKVASMRDAVAELVRDGDTLAIEGFTHLIGFAFVLLVKSAREWAAGSYRRRVASRAA